MIHIKQYKISSISILQRLYKKSQVFALESVTVAPFIYFEWNNI